MDVPVTSTLRSGDVPAAASRAPAINLDPRERAVSIATGAGLVLLGARRGGVGGLLRLLAGAALIGRGATGHSMIYAQLSASPAERRLARAKGWRTAAAVARSVTIAKPRPEVFAFCSNFPNLARVMRHIERIDVLDNRHSRWTLHAPGGLHVTWDAEITELRENERIVWESMPGAMLQSTAWLEFRDAPRERGTEVRALVSYKPPAGQLGRAIARALGDEPGQQAREDLSRLKQILETGEISTNAMRPDQV